MVTYLKRGFKAKLIESTTFCKFKPQLKCSAHTKCLQGLVCMAFFVKLMHSKGLQKEKDDVKDALVPVFVVVVSCLFENHCSV